MFFGISIFYVLTFEFISWDYTPLWPCLPIVCSDGGRLLSASKQLQDRIYTFVALIAWYSQWTSMYNLRIEFKTELILSRISSDPTYCIKFWGDPMNYAVTPKQRSIHPRQHWMSFYRWETLDGHLQRTPVWIDNTRRHREYRSGTIWRSLVGSHWQSKALLISKIARSWSRGIHFSSSSVSVRAMGSETVEQSSDNRLWRVRCRMSAAGSWQNHCQDDQRSGGRIQKLGKFNRRSDRSEYWTRIQ